MIRQRAFWMATMLAALATTSAWAAEDVFHAIPSDALAFAAANRIAETSAKAQKLFKQVGAQPVGLLELTKAVTGVRKGLDETRSAALVAMPGKDSKSEPAAVFLIPVADYKQFLESWDAKPVDKITEVTIVGQALLIAKHGDYAAICPKPFRQGLEKLLDAKRSVADEYPQLIPWLAENDAVAVATSHGVKLASQAIQQQLKQMKEIFAQMSEEGPSPVVVLEMYAKLFQWAEKEVDAVAVAARIDKQGVVHVGKRTRFTKDSAFCATLAKLQPMEKGPLAGMPSGPFMLAGGGPWPQSLAHAMIAFQSDFMKKSYRTAYGIDEKQAEQLVKAALDMPKGLHSFSMMMGPGQPGEPILGGVLGLYDVDNATKYIDDYEKYLRAMNDAVKSADAAGAKNLFSAKKTEVDKRPALEWEVPVPFPPQAAGLPGFEEKMGKLLGPGGKLTILLVAVDERHVAMSFSGRTPLVMRAIAALKRPADSLAADPDVAKTAALLPAGAQWAGYVSPSGGVAFIKWVIDTMADEGGSKPNIPDFPASPPLGIAVKALPGEVQAEAVVSPALLDAIGKYVGLVKSAAHPEVP